MEDIRAEGEPVQESWDAHYYVSQKEGASANQPRLEMIAGYMGRYEQGDSTYLMLVPSPNSTDSLVTAYLFDEQGDSSAVVTADRMLYFDDDGRFEARGNVVVTTTDGKRLVSEHLLWFETKREVRTDGFVQITTPKEQIRGYDLVADENLDAYTIARVTGTMTVEDQ